MEKLLTPEEVAEVIGISVPLVRQLVKDKKLRCVRLNKYHFRVRPEAVQQFIKDSEMD